MSNSSNLMIITDRTRIENIINRTPIWERTNDIDADQQIGTTPLDLVTGVSLYSHWDGLAAPIRALKTSLKYGLDRINDPSYFTRIIARAFTNGDDKEDGSGIKTVSFAVNHDEELFISKEQVQPLIIDCDYQVRPVIDLVSKEIFIFNYSFFGYSFYGETTNCRAYVQPLDQDGITETLLNLCRLRSYTE